MCKEYEPAVAHILHAHRDQFGLGLLAVEVGDRVAHVLDHRLALARGARPLVGSFKLRVRMMMLVSGTSFAVTPKGFSPFFPNGSATSIFVSPTCSRLNTLEYQSAAFL